MISQLLNELDGRERDHSRCADHVQEIFLGSPNCSQPDLDCDPPAFLDRVLRLRVDGCSGSEQLFLSRRACPVRAFPLDRVDDDLVLCDRDGGRRTCLVPRERGNRQVLLRVLRTRSEANEEADQVHGEGEDGESEEEGGDEAVEYPTEATKHRVSTSD